MTYNGWTNHATWLVNLWWNDNLAELARDKDCGPVNADTAADYVFQLVDSVTNDKTVESRFVSDMFTAYMNEVNWEEIADAANA